MEKERERKNNGERKKVVEKKKIVKGEREGERRGNDQKFHLLNF